MNIRFLRRIWYSITRLMRWEDYTTFLQLVFGYMLVKSFRISLFDVSILIESIIILAPLLYGGIYALNDVMDAHKDKLNSIKKHRPIPKGYISRNKAFIFALFLIASAATGATLLSNEKLQIAVVAFLSVNMFYTFLAKHIPYVELLVNGITHPMRVFFGAWLANGVLPMEFYMIWFLGICAGAIFRRIKEIMEKNESSRPVLSHYSRETLVYMYIVCTVTCGVFGLFTEGMVRIVAFGWCVILSVMYHAYFKSKHLRRFIEFAWR